MGHDARAERTPLHEEFGVLVGWSHGPCRGGIRLKVQSAPAERGDSGAEISASHYLMTRNQALILARYLLEATGQTLPGRRMGLLARLKRSLAGD